MGPLPVAAAPRSTLASCATRQREEASFVIHLEDQADLSAAYAIRDQDARGWYVYRTLREHAARTQAPIRALLDSRGVRYEPRWAANVIVAAGDRSLVELSPLDRT